MKQHPTQTLTEIEGNDWGDPEVSSGLVTRVHALRHKPIATFTVEDLRITIGQSVGLQHLLPLALDILESNPLAEGDLFPGDLLASVIRVERLFWESHAALLSRAIAVATTGCDQTDDDELRNACKRFITRHRA